jgi:gamma-glutamyltranspeptidase/glutathione hydrolase
MPDRSITTSSRAGAVCSVDHHASAAGVELLEAGGSAADAAIAASAALAVTTQHMCGLGGDLFALVHHTPGPPDCLNSSGRAGSGADPQRLRDQGFEAMPFRGNISSTPMPGCVDGWLALHQRHGRRPLTDVLAPAIRLATQGFEVPAHLERSARAVQDVVGAESYHALAAGQVLRRPEIAAGLEAIVADGRAGWYGGEFGRALLEVGAGEFTEADLATPIADWVDPIGIEAWGHRLWTVPPNSQGYLSLAAAAILQGVDMPEPETAPWAHLHIEAARLAAADRVDELHEHADGNALLGADRVDAQRAMLDPDRACSLTGRFDDGGTIYVCATDADGMGVSLIQSNAAGFGAHIVAPGTGVFLQNRGIGFNLTPGHRAEYGPGRRPPHTLSPALVCRPDGSLRTVLGTMGGDAQPQIVLQMLSRLLHAGSTAGDVVGLPRWVVEAVDTDGFNTWQEPDAVQVILEPLLAAWADDLIARGHQVTTEQVNTGHAHLIDIDADGVHHGATEPRIDTAAALSPLD